MPGRGGDTGNGASNPSSAHEVVPGVPLDMHTNGTSAADLARFRGYREFAKTMRDGIREYGRIKELSPTCSRESRMFRHDQEFASAW